ncbi:MAG: hypothetical protein CL678_07975 [Bdellovibrionaceae bacterium]|nr:hypothetical protein [Pseudobdellovibrionaceae bacterium]
MANRNSSRMAGEKSIAMEVFAVFVFAAALFSILSLATYSSEDPSFFSNISKNAENWCGIAGAYFSSLLLLSMGLGAFLIPAALLFISATLYQREGAVRVLGIVSGMVFSVMALTVFLTLQWEVFPFGGAYLLTGGAFGSWMAQWLSDVFNPIGASLVAAALFLIAFVMSTPLVVSRALGLALQSVSSWFWRATTVLSTYFIYLLGLFTVRVSKMISQALRHFAFRMMELSHAQLVHFKEYRENKKQLPDPEEPIEVEAEVLNDPVVELEIDEELSMEDEEDELEEEESDEDEYEDDEDEEYEDEEYEEEDEEEDDEEPESSLKKAPEILPRQNEKLEEISQKAAEKLAKARASSRRPGQWKLPSIEFLDRPPKSDASVDREKLIENSRILKQKFADFGIEGEVTAVRPGPVITLYEFKPGPGIKVSRIAALSDDLSMALSARSVRILAPLPGKSVVGIEIPSEQREKVFLREFLSKKDFYENTKEIPVVMGKDIGGQSIMSDLARMPHLLCAGQTGSGKSVFMNGLICSLLYRFTPDELRMILVDPKYIEFRSYQDLPHLLLPIVDDAEHASTALKWAVREMERRYRILAKMEVRNLASFNEKVEAMGSEVVADLLQAEESETSRTSPVSGSDWIESFEVGESGEPLIGKLPYIVVIIDELADLMMLAKKDVEVSIARIAQKARAAGIHLVIATQRPSTDVVTGLIKANLPSRASFSLASAVDSKTILDKGGAERLLGQGDMLFIPPGSSQFQRLHGAFVSDQEINKITSFLRAQGKPVYRDEILTDEEEGIDSGDEDQDALFEEGVALIRHSGHASASFLQRHLKIGYNRAARMIEMMEARGIVGPSEGSKPRQVLIR